MSNVKSEIAAGYDEQAEAFASFADRLVFDHLAAPLAEALAGIEGPVLDVASGTGALARKLPDVVASDLSILQLRHNAVQRKVCADGERLPFADDSFAAIGCAFGVNHFPDASAALSEFARIAPVVGVLTWMRPDPKPHRPKVMVLDVIDRISGAPRGPKGATVERLSEIVGSEEAISGLLSGAGLQPKVVTTQVVVPWPGSEGYVDYRLAMWSADVSSQVRAEVRRAAIEALSELDADELAWRPDLVLGIGTRSD